MEELVYQICQSKFVFSGVRPILRGRLHQKQKQFFSIRLPKNSTARFQLNVASGRANFYTSRSDFQPDAVLHQSVVELKENENTLLSFSSSENEMTTETVYGTVEAVTGNADFTINLTLAPAGQRADDDLRTRMPISNGHSGTIGTTVASAENVAESVTEGRETEGEGSEPPTDSVVERSSISTTTMILVGAVVVILLVIAVGGGFAVYYARNVRYVVNH